MAHGILWRGQRGGGDGGNLKRHSVFWLLQDLPAPEHQRTIVLKAVTDGSKLQYFPVIAFLYLSQCYQPVIVHNRTINERVEDGKH